MAHPRARSPHVCLRQRRYSENPPGPEHKSANRNILESSFPSFSLPIEGSSFVAVNANWESILANFTDARFMKIDEPTSSYGLQRWRALPNTSWGTARNFFLLSTRLSTIPLMQKRSKSTASGRPDLIRRQLGGISYEEA